MDDKAAKINERYQNLITLASNAVLSLLSPSDFGMVVLDDAMQGGASSSAGGGLPAPTAAMSPGSQRLQLNPVSNQQGRVVPYQIALQFNRTGTRLQLQVCR